MADLYNMESQSLLGDERKLDLSERGAILGSFVPLFCLFVVQLFLATVGMGWNRFSGINLRVISAAIGFVQVGHVCVMTKTMYNLYRSSPAAKDDELLAFCRENKSFIHFRLLTNILLLILLATLYLAPSVAVIRAERKLGATEVRAFVGIAFVGVIVDTIAAMKTLLVIRARHVNDYIVSILPARITSCFLFFGIESSSFLSDALAGAHAFLMALLVFVCISLRLKDVLIEVILISLAVFLAFLRYMFGADNCFSKYLIVVCYCIFLLRLASMLYLFVFAF